MNTHLERNNSLITKYRSHPIYIATATKVKVKIVFMFLYLVPDSY